MTSSTVRLRETYKWEEKLDEEQGSENGCVKSEGT